MLKINCGYELVQLIQAKHRSTLLLILVVTQKAQVKYFLKILTRRLNLAT
jgi:hypothetical protein